MDTNELLFHTLDGISKAAEWIDDHFTTADLIRLSFVAGVLRFGLLCM